MKTKHFFLLIVAATFAANVFATDIPKMSIIPLKDSKALISIQQTVPAACVISITNHLGEVMYYKRSIKKADRYKKIFDLSLLESGEYCFTVKSGSNTIKNDLKIKNGVVSLVNKRQDMEPYFASHNDKVILSYLNFEKESMTVRIYDAKDMVFKKKIGDEFAMHRKLDVKALKNGDYDIQLSNKHKEYWFSFSK